MYFGAVAVYLGTYAEGVQQLWAALQSPDPAIVAEALRDGRYGVPDVVTYAGQTGVVEGFTPGTGVTVLAGAMLLPVAVAVAISGLRRETTWRPSWMHVVGSLGPAAAGTSTYAVGNYPDAVPISAVPLLFDLLLLVGFPAVVLVSFFLNRLVVVYPLHRREDLGLP